MTSPPHCFPHCLFRLWTSRPPCSIRCARAQVRCRAFVYYRLRRRFIFQRSRHASPTRASNSAWRIWLVRKRRFSLTRRDKPVIAAFNASGCRTNSGISPICAFRALCPQVYACARGCMPPASEGTTARPVRGRDTSLDESAPARLATVNRQAPATAAVSSSLLTPTGSQCKHSRGPDR